MPAPEGYSTRTLKDFVGHDFGASAPIKVDQVRINTFADVTGDHQWIHVDVARAKKHSPFGGPVAHGFLTLSLMAAAVASAGRGAGRRPRGDQLRPRQDPLHRPGAGRREITTGFKLAGVEDKGDKRQLLRIEAQVNVEGRTSPRSSARSSPWSSDREAPMSKRTETAADLAQSMTRLYANAFMNPAAAMQQSMAAGQEMLKSMMGKARSSPRRATSASGIRSGPPTPPTRR